MKLVIAEKPTLARNFAAAVKAKPVNTKAGFFYQGNGFVVTNALGHLLGLKDVKDYDETLEKWSDIPMPFIPERFEYKLLAHGAKQYKLVAGLIKDERIKSIIHLGDSDREGQLIIDNIIASTGTNKPVQRLWLPAQTNEDIVDGLKNMKDNNEYKKLLDEAKARSFMDWLLGINLTVLLTTKSNSYLPVGRVMIPIVDYVYRRDMEIENFVPVKYYQAKQDVKVKDVEIMFRHPYKADDVETAQKLCTKLNALGDLVLKNVNKREVTVNKPPLFSLTGLQKKVNSLHKISYDKSLEIIQKLYEDGYLTYPRTESEHLTTSEFEKMKSIIAQFGDKFEVKNVKSVFDDSKVESHSAITITSKIPEKGVLKGDEKLVYEAVLRRMQSVFCKEPFIKEIVEYKFLLGEGKVDKPIVFEQKGEAVKQPGFSRYETVKMKKELPSLEEGFKINASFKPEERETSPPKKISESGLFDYLAEPFKYNKELNKLYEEKVGIKLAMLLDEDPDEYETKAANGFSIGTPSSRTGTFEKVKKQQYISQKGQVLSVTDKGKFLIEMLDKLNINLYAEKSVEFEELLLAVQSEDKSLNDVVQEVIKELQEITNVAEKVEVPKVYANELNAPEVGTCPFCGGKVIEIKTKKNKKLWKCNNAECKLIFWQDHKHFQDTIKMNRTKVKTLIKGGKIKETLTSKAGTAYETELVIKKSDNGYINLVRG